MGVSKCRHSEQKEKGFLIAAKSMGLLEGPSTPEAKAAMPDENVTVAEEVRTTNEARIQPNEHEGGTDSSCTNCATSSLPTDEDPQKTIAYAAELLERGSNAIKSGDLNEATECFSRALEIRVAKYGELAQECAHSYYKYGCALLYKAQEEADPLVSVPKKEADSQKGSHSDGKSEDPKNDQCSTTSVASDATQDGDKNPNSEPDDGANGNNQSEDDDEESDAEDLAEADEDDSDLDLAWKMLDIARAIVEKKPGDTIEKVDILSALAEVALEREDFETSQNDYLKALPMLERLDEPDSRRLAELNFRICLCLEIGGKADQAIPYCQKAFSICKARIQRLMGEVKSKSEPPAMSAPDVNENVHQLSDSSRCGPSVSDLEAEIKTLTELSSDLEKKLEDLQQLVSNPTSIVAEVLKIMRAKARVGDGNAGAMSSTQMATANSGPEIESPTVSTAHTNGNSGVTHLGVVGRGVKRVLMNSASVESSSKKKSSVDMSEGSS